MKNNSQNGNKIDRFIVPDLLKSHKDKDGSVALHSKAFTSRVKRLKIRLCDEMMMSKRCAILIEWLAKSESKHIKNIRFLENQMKYALKESNDE